MKKLNYEYKVITEKRLNEKQIKDIENLVNTCNEKDNTELKFYSDGEEDDIIKFLFYDQQKLIAYFGITTSCNFGKSYAWGTLEPKYRTKGIFLKLFNCVKSKCVEKNIRILDFINEKAAASFSDFLTGLGAEKIHSTYEMKFYKECYNKKTFQCNNITFKKATLNDLQDITEIGMEAFGTTEDEEKSYNESNLKDIKYINFIGRFNNIPVGIISTRIENGEGSIADLGVKKSCRRKGFGKTILSKAIDYLLNQDIKKFSLSVETNNKEALLLYKQCGFRIVKVNDCYEMKI